MAFNSDTLIIPWAVASVPGRPAPSLYLHVVPTASVAVVHATSASEVDDVVTHLMEVILTSM